MKFLLWYNNRVEGEKYDNRNWFNCNFNGSFGCIICNQQYEEEKFKINVNTNNSGQNRDSSGTEVIISRRFKKAFYL